MLRPAAPLRFRHRASGPPERPSDQPLAERRVQGVDCPRALTVAPSSGSPCASVTRPKQAPPEEVCAQVEHTANCAPSPTIAVTIRQRIDPPLLADQRARRAAHVTRPISAANPDISRCLVITLDLPILNRTSLMTATKSTFSPQPASGHKFLGRRLYEILESNVIGICSDARTAGSASQSVSTEKASGVSVHIRDCGQGPPPPWQPMRDSESH
jgi:hypothetical protein